MLEGDLDYSAVPFSHVNPVSEYYCYNPNSRCFVCGDAIKDGKFPYPGFDVHFYSDDRAKTIFLFEQVGSSVTPEKWDVPRDSFGAFVTACPTHGDNLRALRELFKHPDRYNHTGKISSQAIQEAKTL
jgi:hypothetical protein